MAHLRYAAKYDPPPILALGLRQGGGKDEFCYLATQVLTADTAEVMVRGGP